MLSRILVSSLFCVFFSFTTVSAQDYITHLGVCDASGIVRIDQEHFAVADDELNRLKIFNIFRDGNPVVELEISSFLGNIKIPKSKSLSRKKTQKKIKLSKPKAKIPKTIEADLEGATRIGNLIYWISSHGSNDQGETVPARQRFFATKIINQDSTYTLEAIGHVYENLLQDLLADIRYRDWIQVAMQIPVKTLGALNIEGLTDRPDGSLLIALQSPKINGQGLIIPLLNPSSVIQGDRAVFADPIFVDLNGAGIRGLASDGNYYLIASSGEEELGLAPAIYEWDGRSSEPRIVQSFAQLDFKPESLAIFPEKQRFRVVIVSDDGTRLIQGVECKRLKDATQKKFRSFNFISTSAWVRARLNKDK